MPDEGSPAPFFPFPKNKLELLASSPPSNSPKNACGSFTYTCRLIGISLPITSVSSMRQVASSVTSGLPPSEDASCHSSGERIELRYLFRVPSPLPDAERNLTILSIGLDDATPPEFAVFLGR